jgi:hypothetical protein
VYWPEKLAKTELASTLEMFELVAAELVRKERGL